MFAKIRAGVMAGLVLTCVSAGLVGCPLGGNNIQFSILVSSKTLNFGTDSTSESITVRKSFSSRVMTPLIVTPNVSWLTLTSPLDPNARISTGPTNKFTLTFAVNRSQMVAGLNEGSVTLSSVGAPPVVINVTAVQRVVADFSASTVIPYVGETVQFTDLTAVAPGEGPIQTYLWDFGDGTTSTEANPAKIYSAVGLYDVSLTVTVPNGTSTKVKLDYISVTEPSGPVADFTSDATGGNAVEGQPIQFTNLTDTGSVGLGETTWLWDFGDGTTSTLQDPVKSYDTVGTYTVSLTATTVFGVDTEVKTAFISVVVRVAPTVDFVASTVVAIEGETITFTPNITNGSLPVISTTWTFGDGGTSAQNMPGHAYASAGTYTVSLTASTAAESVTTTKTAYITVLPATALDRYVRKADTSYSFNITQQVSTSSSTRTWLVDLVSQTWMTAAEVYRVYNSFYSTGIPTTWNHKLVISAPIGLKGGVNDTALLIIDGRENGEDVSGDTAFITNMESLAEETQSVVAMVSQIPNQPIVFTDAQNAELRDDEAIAYTFDKFLNDPADEEWPMLLPMVKSVVRAMDTVQDVTAGAGVEVDNFVVTGLGIQGWTAWLTAAVDPGKRVNGLVPLAADLLNFEPATVRHIQSYGAISPGLAAYDNLQIFDSFGTLQGDALLEIVDPYAYIERLLQPKYIVNATNDAKWLPDAAEFYFGDLLGENHIAYVPGVGGDLGGALASPSVLDPLLAFFQDIATGAARPSVNYSYSAGNSQVTVTTSQNPASVVLWQAFDATTAHRDFRSSFQSDGITPLWTSAPLSPVQNNTYVGTVSVPAANTGWRAYFVEVTFIDGSVYTSEIRVVPNTLPFPAP